MIPDPNPKHPNTYNAKYGFIIVEKFYYSTPDDWYEWDGVEKRSSCHNAKGTRIVSLEDAD